MGFLFFIAKRLLIDAHSINDIASSFGLLGPIVLILLTSLGVLFTPIPAGLLVITAGYLYGVWLGSLYAYLGLLIAAISVFATFRKINGNGTSKTYQKYKEVVDKNKKILYLLYLVPVIPISIITFLAASSKIRWKEFLKMIFLGFTPAVIFLAYFGERITQGRIIEIILFILITLAAIIIIIVTLKKHGFSRKKH